MWEKLLVDNAYPKLIVNKKSIYNCTVLLSNGEIRTENNY